MNLSLSLAFCASLLYPHPDNSERQYSANRRNRDKTVQLSRRPSTLAAMRAVAPSCSPRGELTSG